MSTDLCLGGYVDWSEEYSLAMLEGLRSLLGPDVSLVGIVVRRMYLGCAAAVPSTPASVRAGRAAAALPPPSMPPPAGQALTNVSVISNATNTTAPPLAAPLPAPPLPPPTGGQFAPTPPQSMALHVDITTPDGASAAALQALLQSAAENATMASSLAAAMQTAGLNATGFVAVAHVSLLLPPPPPPPPSARGGASSPLISLLCLLTLPLCSACWYCMLCARHGTRRAFQGGD